MAKKETDNRIKIKYYEKCVELNPYNPKHFKDMADNYRFVDREKVAMYYKKAIDMDPNYETALRSLGMFYQEEGSYIRPI